MNFFMEYIKHPFTVGAVAPSSRYLAKKMMDAIDFNHCGCIVEYGPGTGAFTREVLRNKKDDTKYFIIELNQEFYKKLKEKYGGRKNVYVIHDSAENTKKHLKKHGIECADYIVSGLPFASLPTEMSQNIFHETCDIIGKTGQFITFQYTLFKKKFFSKYFNIDDITKENRNLPPAYVFVMSNVK
jgi:phospholipid N-methyltransferase